MDDKELRLECLKCATSITSSMTGGTSQRISHESTIIEAEKMYQWVSEYHINDKLFLNQSSEKIQQLKNK